MRTLSTTELEQVSGAGAFADAVKLLGESIGAIVELTGKKGATEAGANLGNAIGNVVESGLDMLSGFFKNWFGRK
ncbi:hypothetical protein ACQKDS_13555 [Serratia sp. NPDC078593]|uniref:hypothetical protein n=1 Tax=unclassified Serratia (in: enterobacteria) TaxID=2647522 RepID=UPI0037D35F01